MMIELPELRWYAVRVRSNREWTVAAAARGKGIEEFVPRYRVRRQWSDRVREVELPLFAGYVFCRLDVRQRLPVLTIPGVVGFVGTREGPLPVEEEEIAALQRVASSGAPAAPWPYLQVGQRVRITRGPLRGLEGLLAVVKSDYRLVVSVTLLQRSVAVEVDRDAIVPIGHPAAGARPSYAAAVRTG